MSSGDRRLLAGVRFDPESSVPQLWFMADAHVDEDGRAIVPVMRDGRLVVFSDPGASEGAVVEPDLLVDVAHALYCLESEVDDEAELVHETLTLILTLVQAVEQTIPAPFLTALVAARETAVAGGDGESLGSLDAKTRAAAIDGVLWAVGAIAVLSTVG